jgi:aspartyl-tRNA(Asn)/glutamyl-tRNA(Gln) amidotransferase subunit A
VSARPDDLADATASELLELYASGTATPVEAVEDCLARIERLEPALNAIITLLADDALDAAAASARRWNKGNALALDGVPYALKDIIATAGIRTTGGSALYTDLVPTESAVHAARLQAAGAILMAKLGTFEFACGGADNQTFGMVRNPWDTDRTTGGSSSGSGAAVAAGYVPLAIGTDTGGSIRIPAAYCGITGLKPTYGRVPRHGVMGLSWTLDHAGPMTRSAEDAALMMWAIAGHDRRDATSSTVPVPDYPALLDQPVAGLRFGRPGGFFEEPIHPAVLAAFEASLAELEALGIEVVDIEIPEVEIAAAAAWTTCYAEMLSLHEQHFPTLEDRDSMGAGMLASSPFVSAGDYLRSQRYRSIFQAQLEAAMDGLAGFVLPGATTPAPPLATMRADVGLEDLDWLEVATRNHIPFNFSGQPGLCLPCGMAAGMPASLQLIGRPHDDALLLAVGKAYQGATDHHLARPPILEAVPA